MNHHFAPRLAWLLALLCAACGGGAGTGGPVGPAGQEIQKPGGGTFLLDPHLSGGTTSLRLIDVAWGRLVDVHALDPNGDPEIAPFFRDVVIRQGILSDGVNYVLSTNPLTQRTRLVIQRPSTSSAFLELLRQAETGLPSVVVKADDGTSAPPFSLVPRNATFVLRFNDLLDDRPEVRAELGSLVRIRTGYPPDDPHQARVVFDENHGGLAGGTFHPTRILVDFSVSVDDVRRSDVALSVNSEGLPASDRFLDGANGSLQIPTQLDFPSGIFRILRGLSGVALDANANGPVGSGRERPVVRAFRSGNPDDVNGGFLLDLRAPQLLGQFAVRVTEVEQDPTGRPGFDFLMDLRFQTPCRSAPQIGDVLDLGVLNLELPVNAGAPDAAGNVRDVRASLLSEDPLLTPSTLLGLGRLVTPYRTGLPVVDACWVTFTPPARTPPASGVPPDASIQVRFSEPMNPDSLGAFETVRLIRGNASGGGVITPGRIVVGQLVPSADLQQFTYHPDLNLNNTSDPSYYVDLDGSTTGVQDLSGNALAVNPPNLGFTVDTDADPVLNGGFVLGFSSIDELPPFGFNDFRGQVQLDEERGLLRPRPVLFGTFPIDRSVPLPGAMSVFAPGVQTPLSPLGSKLMSLWRYADVGWQVRDENFHNVDVMGMSFAPVGGNVFADRFERFEIRLAHSSRNPDEAGTILLGPLLRDSGLRPGPNPFNVNILPDPRNPQTVVHSRELGYVLDPADRFLNAGGTIMMPFPWNRNGGPLTTYTWRDTAILAKDGTLSAGVPLQREAGLPGFEGPVGSVAIGGQVPSIGLPLLWEIRCFPSTTGIGLNPLSVAIPLLGFRFPHFRAYSTGGVNVNGQRVDKDPDFEDVPTGGFNPSSQPPGRPTLFNTESVFYYGQMDIVIRISRAHTAWIDTQLGNPLYLDPLIEPSLSSQPPGTDIVLEYRGADDFQSPGPNDPFDGQALDWYGNLFEGETIYHDGVSTWTDRISDVNGSQFLQIRMSFIADIESMQVPELSALGFAFTGE